MLLPADCHEHLLDMADDVSDNARAIVWNRLFMLKIDVYCLGWEGNGGESWERSVELGWEKSMLSFTALGCLSL